MTNLERAIYLAKNAIIEKYPNTCELSDNEKQDYFYALVAYLMSLIREGMDAKDQEHGRL